MERAPAEPPLPTELERRPEGLPPDVWLAPWRDEATEAWGFDARSVYVESCWLPVLGPTATWLYRRLGSWAAFNSDGRSIDMADLALSLGLGEGLSKSSALNRAMDRLTRFDVARWNGWELQVRTALGPVHERHVARFSPTVVRLHEEFVRRPKRGLPGARVDG